MKTLVVIDPGMDVPGGHHLSANAEIALSAQELGFECAFLASRACNRADFESLGCSVTPVFSIGPYLLSDCAVEELASYMTSERELSAEYRASPIPDGACVLMHTSSPWHLRALAVRLKDVRNVKVAVGLMLPVSFWTKDPTTASLLERMTEDALSQLSRHDCFIYSETGQVDGAATLSLPLSARTLADIARYEEASARRPESHVVKFGYFGRRLPQKGFDMILEVLGKGVPAECGGVSLNFFFPPDHEDISAHVNALSPVAHASSLFRDNSRYIQDMMSVDVVLCFYDPAFYGHQMSGIVGEAALLGKATLLAKGTSLQRFLDRYSPGSYCAAEFNESSLIEALSQPAGIWRQKQRRAKASRTVVRELKRAERFFGAAFGVEPAAG